MSVCSVCRRAAQGTCGGGSGLCTIAYCGDKCADLHWEKGHALECIAGKRGPDGEEVADPNEQEGGGDKDRPILPNPLRANTVAERKRAAAAALATKRRNWSDHFWKDPVFDGGGGNDFLSMPGDDSSHLLDNWAGPSDDLDLTAVTAREPKAALLPSRTLGAPEETKFSEETQNFLDNMTLGDFVLSVVSASGKRFNISLKLAERHSHELAYRIIAGQREQIMPQTSNYAMGVVMHFLETGEFDTSAHQTISKYVDVAIAADALRLEDLTRSAASMAAKLALASRDGNMPTAASIQQAAKITDDGFVNNGERTAARHAIELGEPVLPSIDSRNTQRLPLDYQTKQGPFRFYHLNNRILWRFVLPGLPWLALHALRCSHARFWEVVTIFAITEFSQRMPWSKEFPMSTVMEALVYYNVHLVNPPPRNKIQEFFMLSNLELAVVLRSVQWQYGAWPEMEHSPLKASILLAMKKAGSAQDFIAAQTNARRTRNYAIFAELLKTAKQGMTKLPYLKTLVWFNQWMDGPTSEITLDGLNFQRAIKTIKQTTAAMASK